MLDQSCNPNCFLLVVLLFRIYLFQDIVLLSLLFKLSKNLMLSFIAKVTTLTQRLALFVINVASSGFFPSTWGDLEISDIIQLFNHGKLIISHLIKGKWRNFEKLLKHFHETTTSASNLQFINFILVIVSQTSWCHRIIDTIF